MSLIVLEGIDGLAKLPPGAVVSIGNFDGVHRGHQQIIDTGKALRDADGATALAIVTFEPHPLTVLRPEWAPPRLTPLWRKRELLESVGVDYLVVLPPSREVLNLTAEEFWAILRDKVRPSHIIEGEDFTFGKARGGTIERLAEWSAGSGIKLHIVSPVTVPLLNLNVVPVGSTLIRWLIANGRVRDAGICLGRSYSVTGEIVKGYQRGRTIGIPTANFAVTDQLVPLDGVYAGRCAVEGKTYVAAVSIGTMPTFGENQRQVEAYLLGYNGPEIYGQTLTLDITDWVREQWKLPGIDALKEQIARDIAWITAEDFENAVRPIAAVEKQP